MTVEFTFHHVSIKTHIFLYTSTALFSFTFHHVSIKTVLREIKAILVRHSHSTMYLLKRKSRVVRKQINRVFTFHHVSIKTVIILLLSSLRMYSHSTMYLLKPTVPFEVFNRSKIHIPPCIY